MKTYNLKALAPAPAGGPPRIELHSEPKFKVILITLPRGGAIPTCEMASRVIFTVIDGTVEITVNKVRSALGSGECLITEPAFVSMRSSSGARVMGTQIH